MQEFKVNDLITLKLENKETIIYVTEERFRQCKQLILNIPITEITTLEEIESIDEVIEKLGISFEIQKYEIPPETEFWGHCSNLQVWVENKYNTKLLHSNLAFPLLRKLVEVGDQVAKRVFKEEICKRFENSNPIAQIFLLENEYLDYLEIEELEVLSENLNPEKFLKLNQKILNLSSTHDKRTLIYKKLSSLDKLFERLLSFSEGEILLEYLIYSNPNQLRLLLDDSESRFFENFLIALKNHDLSLGWNPFYFLEPLFQKIAEKIRGNLRYRIIEMLKKKDMEDLLILIKLQWINLREKKDLKDLITNSKINFRKQLSKLIEEKIKIIDFDVNCYDLIFILIFLEKIKNMCGKLEILKINRSLKKYASNYKQYLAFIKKNIEKFELRNIKKTQIILNKLFEEFY